MKINPLKTRRGLSLIEALISLAISATLLVALAAAFHASAGTVKNNDAYFRCTQTARLTLNQILTEIRRADAIQVDPSGIRLQIIRPADQLTPGEIDREYIYDPIAKRIALQIDHANKLDNTNYELAENVTACKFSSNMPDTDAATIPRCISVYITCSQDGTAVTLAGSATPRRGG